MSFLTQVVILGFCACMGADAVGGGSHWTKKVSFATSNLPERAWTGVPPVQQWWDEKDPSIIFQEAQFAKALWGLVAIPEPEAEPLGGDDHVRVNVYEIGGSMTPVLSASCCKKLPLVPHTGVRVWGEEFFYSNHIERRSSSDMSLMLPQDGYPQVRFDLGATTREKGEIEKWLINAEGRFNQSSYNLWDRNCNHFSKEFVEFLLPGTGIPLPILSPIIDVTDGMLDTVPNWRREAGLTFMNEFSRIVLRSWSKVVKGEKNRR